MSLMYNGMKIARVYHGGKRISLYNNGKLLLNGKPVIETRWTGEPYKSPSELLVDGEVACTQYLVNPFNDSNVSNWRDELQTVTMIRELFNADYTIPEGGGLDVVLTGLKDNIKNGDGGYSGKCFIRGSYTVYNKTGNNLTGLTSSAMFRSSKNYVYGVTTLYDGGNDRPQQGNLVIGTLRSRQLPADQSKWMLTRLSAFCNNDSGFSCGVGTMFPNSVGEVVTTNIRFMSLVSSNDNLMALGIACFDGNRILYDKDLPEYQIVTG